VFDQVAYQIDGTVRVHVRQDPSSSIRMIIKELFSSILTREKDKINKEVR
jgi:hypothetical protein